MPFYRYSDPDHRSQLAEQDQDQNDDDHEAEPAAPIVAGPVEVTTPDPAEAAQQDDDQDDEQDRADGHEQSPSFSPRIGGRGQRRWLANPIRIPTPTATAR